MSELNNPLNLRIISFRCGLLWYACCEIPSVEHKIYYYDNTPFDTIVLPVTLHVVGLSYDRVHKKMIHKLKAYFTERKHDYN